MVGERLRRGAAAALAAVDDDEVGRELEAAREDALGEVVANQRPPIAVLMPTGLPVRSRSQAILSSSWSVFAMSGWRFGLIES